MVSNQNLVFNNKQEEEKQLVNNLMGSLEVREKVIRQLEKHIKYIV